MSQQQGKGGDKKSGKAPAQGTISASGIDRTNDLRTDTSILTTHQKSLLGSGFADSAAERKRTSALGSTVPGAQKIPQAPEAPATQTFDGKTVPEALQARDVWKALQAPLQSRAGKRSKELLLNVVNQFGMMVNKRYDEDAPGKIRGHIFVWDVSRAMDCEIPHFVGAKELTLAQTCDWLRHEGPMRGWKRVSDPDLYEAAEAGHLVVALPRESRTKHIALVLPQEPASDRSPKLYGICLKRDVAVHPRDMFGAKPIDCFYHD
ncbi:MAG: hypothetical protein JNM17_32190 [Archangium sp.]|nr:hypothetical protein [Archangium sp.]